MSAKISKMYKDSGGCVARTCEECGYLSILEERKTKTIYRCDKHKELCGEDAIWKPTYIACKFFKERNKKREKSKKNR